MKSFISKFCEVKPLYNTIKLIDQTLQNVIFFGCMGFCNNIKIPKQNNRRVKIRVPYIGYWIKINF
jgi:hypothetical protein